MECLSRIGHINSCREDDEASCLVPNKEASFRSDACLVRLWGLLRPNAGGSFDIEPEDCRRRTHVALVTSDVTSNIRENVTESSNDTVPRAGSIETRITVGPSDGRDGAFLGGSNERVTFFQHCGASFGRQIPKYPGLRLRLVRADPPDASTLLVNAASVSGCCCVVDRGNCGFAEKARHAEAAGAVAMLVVSSGDDISGHMGFPDDLSPSDAMNAEDSATHRQVRSRSAAANLRLISFMVSKSDGACVLNAMQNPSVRASIALQIGVSHADNESLLSSEEDRNAETDSLRDLPILCEQPNSEDLSHIDD